MDTFTLIVLGGIVGLVLFFLAIGFWSPVRSSDIANRGQRKAMGEQARLEERDVGEMVEGQNVYRRRRGRRETSEGEVRARIGAEERAKLDEADREMRDQGR